MPSKLIISIETDGGDRRDLHTIDVPDLPPNVGVGSRHLAEKLAAGGISHIGQELSREEATWEAP